MKQFIADNIKIIWLVSVITMTGALIIINNIVLSLLQKKWSKAKKFSSVIDVLKRLIKFFLIFFGMGLLSYLFFEENTYAFINESLVRIIWIALVLFTTILGLAFSQNYFQNKIDSLSRRDNGDITSFKYANYLSTFAIYLLGGILIALSIPALKNVAASAMAGAGVFALVAGVAAQEGIANLVGGLFIAFFKPFRIGDVIKIGSQIMGTVEDINLRHTVINSFQNKRVIIPNAIINKENITNFYMTEAKICEWIEVGISYDSDIEKAIEIMREECERHPFCMDNRSPQEKENKHPIVDVQVVELGESSVNLKAWVWCATYITGFKMRNQLNKSIKLRFDKDSIEIPFPHRTLVFKNAPVHFTP